MTLAELVVEIRKRATGQPQPASVEHAIALLMGLTILPGAEAQAARAVLVALAHAHTSPEFDQAQLDALGPLAIGAFDRFFEAMLDGSCTDQMLRELLRPAVVRRVQ
jgi:hypothetical protein